VWLLHANWLERAGLWPQLPPEGQVGNIPLLQVDMWEHAYYLQYKNVKADYVKAFWNVVNWADVQDRFAAATSRTSGLIL